MATAVITRIILIAQGKGKETKDLEVQVHLLV